MEVLIKLALIGMFLFLVGSALGIPERIATWGKPHAHRLFQRATRGEYNRTNERNATAGRQHHGKPDSPWTRHRTL